MTFAAIRAFLREVAQKWSRDNALTLGAALSYYTVFSMAPLLVLVIAIAGLAFGRAAVAGEIVGQIEQVLGPSGAKLIETMIASASKPSTGVIATLVSLATMFFGASGAFGQLQIGLNLIWNVELGKRSGVRRQLRRRGLSLAMVIVIGIVLFISLALSAVISGLHSAIEDYFTVPAIVFSLSNHGVSFAVVMALFALIFKFLPDARIELRDVWLGAGISALLFTLGKSLIGIYLGRAGVTSVYGAAGSLVLVLLWVYYSSQMLFLGAVISEVYSRRFGSRRVAQ